MDEQVKANFAELLNPIAARLNPAHQAVFGDFSAAYYWSVHQSEWATDVMFNNPSAAATAPDGDADLDGINVDAFEVPGCTRCGGMLKPAVVFFGECVPPSVVTDAYARLVEADALLVVGSSLMVYSGYRFARAAAESGKPIAAINLGRTHGRTNC